MRRIIIGVATVVAALALTGAALAGPGGGQKAEGYEGPGESVQGQVQQGVPGAGISGGALPFSGQDLTFLAIGGVALILAGTAFFRLSRRRS